MRPLKLKPPLPYIHKNILVSRWMVVKYRLDLGTPLHDSRANPVLGCGLPRPQLFMGELVLWTRNVRPSASDYYLCIYTSVPYIQVPTLSRPVASLPRPVYETFYHKTVKYISLQSKTQIGIHFIKKRFEIYITLTQNV